MSKKRTPEEVAAEIAALQNLKPVGPFKRKTEATIAVQIDALRGHIDFTAEEFHEMPDEQQMAAQDADNWKNGAGDEQPSAGWGSLVEQANEETKSMPTTTVSATPKTSAKDCHGLDTPAQVFFYEQDFYVLSNFSAFTIVWKEHRFHTSEAAYHWEKFNHLADRLICNKIATAPSAHEAFKIAELCRGVRRPDWDDVKVEIMREILRAKAGQHEYVRRKLLATGHRELVENSWRDDFWGWGPNRAGKNMLGRLWMEVRAELRAQEGGT